MRVFETLLVAEGAGALPGALGPAVAICMLVEIVPLTLRATFM